MLSRKDLPAGAQNRSDLRSVFAERDWEYVESALVALGFTPWTSEKTGAPTHWDSPEVAASVAKRMCRTPHTQPSEHLLAVCMEGMVEGRVLDLHFEVAPCCKHWAGIGRTERFINQLYAAGIHGA